MEISEVRVKLVERSSERLRAFCSITFDGDFVVRDLKIIDGVNGAFVAMPSRKLADRCPRCGSKNHLRAKHCNECGSQLNENRAPKDGDGRAKLHADVAHPINAECRERIQNIVVQAYQEELERAKSPDYKPARIDDYDDADLQSEAPSAPPAPPTSAAPPPSPRPEKKQETDDGDGEVDDYNALIADLKREASERSVGQKTAAPRRDSEVDLSESPFSFGAGLTGEDDGEEAGERPADARSAEPDEPPVEVEPVAPEPAPAPRASEPP